MIKLNYKELLKPYATINQIMSGYADGSNKISPLTVVINPLATGPYSNL